MTGSIHWSPWEQASCPHHPPLSQHWWAAVSQLTRFCQSDKHGVYWWDQCHWLRDERLRTRVCVSPKNGGSAYGRTYHIAGVTTFPIHPTQCLPSVFQKMGHFWQDGSLTLPHSPSVGMMLNRALFGGWDVIYWLVLPPFLSHTHSLPLGHIARFCYIHKRLTL